MLFAAEDGVRAPEVLVVHYIRGVLVIQGAIITRTGGGTDLRYIFLSRAAAGIC